MTKLLIEENVLRQALEALEMAGNGHNSIIHMKMAHDALRAAKSRSTERMNKVTKEMIGAAHDICLKKGDFVLSAALLERIYLAMDALANHNETSGSLNHPAPAVEKEQPTLEDGTSTYDMCETLMNSRRN